MNYHGIVKDDMLNGSGMRVVVFVAGCDHHCKNCHNPETWTFDSGVPFTKDNMNTIIEFAKDPAISGLTMSGGDPLNPKNIETVCYIMQSFKDVYPDKNIWAYTGYTLDDLMKYMSEGSIPGYREHLQKAFELIDVLVDGPFIESLKDEQYPWAGSTNQRVINLKETLKTNPIDEYTSLIPILFSYGN